ncbi:MAG: monovalent cation:proton antiporter-2 (CPA2) family protein [Sterolibacterium sp.]|nr:monovalent cation:proton antiporter-2 (CPA2) family protein [Sterolibacterium sp.]
MLTTLPLVLLLLVTAVLVVALCRSLNVPPLIGYLLVGAALGPHAFGLMHESAGTRHLAEFGVVFLMFTIGLEFSLPRLFSMRRIVFGLGLAQVVVTSIAILLVAWLVGLSWQGALALGGTLAMSSTAVASKLLVERMELDSAHGRQIMGVLLFQDIAVVPLLILLPALAGATDSLPSTLLGAVFKAALLLGVVLVFGQRLMRAWFTIVARRKSGELFMLNVLLITLGLSYLTELAGLSLALGAFLAGMLISETEYRFEVEEDIKPFRDVLLGLFFITVGMYLNPALIIQNWLAVVGALLALLTIKLAITMGLARLFGAPPGEALRTGLWLCAGGEFGFVLLELLMEQHLVTSAVSQTVLAALVLSLMLSPLLIHFSDKIVMRLVASEWMERSMALTQIAAQAITSNKHAILCGYGRTGQHLARFLEMEGISYVAIDLDPERVGEAAAAGDQVAYGDAARRETLIAAGIQRADVVVVTSNDPQLALRVLHHARELRPGLPVVVRAAEDMDIASFEAAGAAEVVPEALESSVMLATHALALLGVPMHRVIKRLREVREQHYVLLRGFFHGASDIGDHLSDAQQPRLLTVVLTEGAHAIGRKLGELGLDQLDAAVSAIRRRGIRGIAPDPEIRLEAGDVVVILGVPAAVAAAEERLLRGK